MERAFPHPFGTNLPRRDLLYFSPFVGMESPPKLTDEFSPLTSSLVTDVGFNLCNAISGAHCALNETEPVNIRETLLKWVSGGRWHIHNRTVGLWDAHTGAHHHSARGRFMVLERSPTQKQ